MLSRALIVLARASGFIPGAKGGLSSVKSGRFFCGIGPLVPLRLFHSMRDCPGGAIISKVSLPVLKATVPARTTHAMSAVGPIRLGFLGSLKKGSVGG